jgi:L-cysteine:1D-myo-inositol 2-amino-2-deoxy-alpha-D-glucopyranoside ligase
MDSWRAATLPSLPGTGPEPYVTNTATGQLTLAAAGPAASLYACGITPYDATHIGHAATYLAWDLLVRAWRDAGHDVTYVQNVTDVDDPLLERADRDGEDWRELAAREIARYRSDMAALRILPPTHLVGAVEALPLIERFNQVLADRGALYELERDFYFSRAADPAFGAVSHLDPATMLELSAERGGDPARPGKKDPLDPLVWLAARPARGGGAAAEPSPGAGRNEPSWESPFGPGRPGWHVECAAIATSYLGPVFDVQAGGSDLVYPHHEFSASHARVAFANPPAAGDRVGDGSAGRGRERRPGAGARSAGGGESRAFARVYVHSGMVRLDGEKMSKSLGNLVFVSRLVAGGADPMAIRLAIMSHRYRMDWDWTAAGLASAQDRLDRWRAAVTRALSGGGPAGPGSAAGGGSVAAFAAAAGPGLAERGAAGPSPAPRGAAGPGLALPPAQSVLAAVRERIADDLDAPGALAAVDAWATAVLGAPVLPPGLAGPAGLVRDTVDALLGVAL